VLVVGGAVPAKVSWLVPTPLNGVIAPNVRLCSTLSL
jgi:hypothetical protein